MEETKSAKVAKLKQLLEPILLWLGVPFQTFRSAFGSKEREQRIRELGLANEEDYADGQRPDFHELSQRALTMVAVNPPSNSTGGKDADEIDGLGLLSMAAGESKQNNAGKAPEAAAKPNAGAPIARQPLRDVTNKPRQASQKVQALIDREKKADGGFGGDAAADAGDDADFAPEMDDGGEDDAEYEESARGTRKSAAGSSAAKQRNPEWTPKEVQIVLEVCQAARDQQYVEDAKQQLVIKQSAKLAHKHTVRLCRSLRGDSLSADDQKSLVDAELVQTVPAAIVELWAEARRSVQALTDKFSEVGEEWRLNRQLRARHKALHNKYNLSDKHMATVQWWADLDETPVLSTALEGESDREAQAGGATEGAELR